MVSKITDHSDQAVERLHSFHRDKPNIEALLRILTDPMQDIEDALWQLYTERLIDVAVGEQLNVLGRIVGQPRAGLSDADYRRYIRARIATNKSKGRHSDILSVARLILDDSTTGIVAEDSDYATLLVELTGTEISDDLADILIAFLRQTKSTGVRLLFYYGADDDEAFLFGGGTGSDFTGASVSIGATSINTLGGATDFYGSGEILVSQGTAREEIVAYTSLESGTFSGLLTTVAHNFGDTITQYESGNGLGDTADANTGGELVAVLS